MNNVKEKYQCSVTGLWYDWAEDLDSTLWFDLNTNHKLCISCGARAVLYDSMDEDNEVNQ